MAEKSVNRPEGGAWQVYIVQCHDGTLYTGITNNVARRLREHNAGTASKYTRGRRPVKLLAIWHCAGKPDALKMEYKLKALSRQDKLKAVNSAKTVVAKLQTLK